MFYGDGDARFTVTPDSGDIFTDHSRFSCATGRVFAKFIIDKFNYANKIVLLR